jgi:serine/threonine protein kinase
MHVQADVWSAGVVLYLMLFSRHPFLDEGDNHNGAYPRTCRRILAGEYAPFPRGHKVSAAALDLVRRMLVCNPVRRLSIADIMAHAWFAQDFPSKARNWNEQYLRSAAAPPHTEAELRAIFAKAIAA